MGLSWYPRMISAPIPSAIASATRNARTCNPISAICSRRAARVIVVVAIRRDPPPGLPVMPTPIASGAASGANSPVIRPSYNVTMRSESA